MHISDLQGIFICHMHLMHFPAIFGFKIVQTFDSIRDIFFFQISVYQIVYRRVYLVLQCSIVGK